jgi:PAS domain S-box-containing protein
VTIHRAHGEPATAATTADSDAREELRRAAARLATVHEIDRAILAAESPSEIAERVAERLRQLAGATRVAISAIDTSRGVLTVLAFSQDGEAGSFLPGTEFPIEGTLDPRVLASRETVVHRDLVKSAETLPLLRTAVDAGYRAAVITPLVAGDRVVGVMSIAGRDQDVASDDNVQVATEVGAQLAVAIDHATARERLERSNTRLALVHEIDRAILSAATPHEIASSVAIHLLTLLAADSVGVAAYHGPHREMLAIEGEGSDLVRARMAAGGPQRPAAARLPATREVLTFERIEDAFEIMPAARLMRELGMTVGMIVPLVFDGDVIGNIGLAGRDTRLIAPETITIGREVGDQLAIALEQARRREALERSALRQQLVHEIDQAILASESPQELAKRVAEPLLTLVGGRRLDISAYDLERDEGRILGFAQDEAGPATPVGTVYKLRFTVPMATNPRPTLTAFDDLPRFADSVPLTRNSVAAGLTNGAWIPMLTGGRLIGAVSIAGDEPVMLQEETLSIARAMTDQLAVAFQHAADRAALEERESRLRAILEASPNGILVVSGSGRIQYANPAAHRLFGAPDGALTGARHDALVPEASSEAHHDHLQGWFTKPSSGPPHPVNTEARRLDGTTIPVHVLLARVETAGEVLAITTVVDLSERAMLEARLRQAERLQVLGQFAGILAHDVRNHLTAIAWSAELLGSDLPAGDPRQEDVELIQRATQDAVDMTRSVLEFARPTGDPRGSLDVVAHLGGARTMLERILGEAITLELELDERVPPAAINPTALTQVLGNLATNARDAMPEGGAFRLGARAAVVAPGSVDQDGLPLEPGRYVRLVASDTGTGMDEATRRRAFEAFFTTKTLPSTGRGSGLGLSSVFMLVTRAGGTVRVESEPGRGTTFILDLLAAD